MGGSALSGVRSRRFATGRIQRAPLPFGVHRPAPSAPTTGREDQEHGGGSPHHAGRTERHHVSDTNRAYKHWPEIFNHDATLTSAVLDRLLHHAETVTLEGKASE